MPFPPFFSITNFHQPIPLLSTLAPCITTAFILQSAGAIRSLLTKTARLYDLSASLTFITVTGLSLYLPALRARAAAQAAGLPLPSWPNILSALSTTPGVAAQKKGLLWNWRQVVVCGAVLSWAVKLGISQYRRIRGSTSTSPRKSEVESPSQILAASGAQAARISLTLLPVLALNAIPTTTLASPSFPLLMFTDAIGISLYASGMGFGHVADPYERDGRSEPGKGRQKTTGRKEQQGGTLTQWFRSTNADYDHLGESMVWTGIVVMTGGVIVRDAAVRGLGLSAETWMGRASTIWGKLVASMMCAVSLGVVTFAGWE